MYFIGDLELFFLPTTPDGHNVSFPVEKNLAGRIPGPGSYCFSGTGKD